MVVTKLEELGNNRYKVYLDEQFAFVLYKGELSRYKVKCEAEIQEEEYRRIRSEIILKRAKKRILYLLEQMPRTEQQIKVKMKQNYYPEDIIEEAIIYAKGFGYINDETYARSFVQMKQRTKSKKELYALLLGKGVKKEVIEACFEESYQQEDEKEAIRSIIRKKGIQLENITEKEKSKIYSYLMRKGFLYTDICQVLRVSEWNA